MARELAVTVLGTDRPGIVAAVTRALADLGGNLEDSSMTILRGHFAMTLILSVDAPASVVQRTLEPVCASLGVRAAVTEVPEAAEAGRDGVPFVLTVHGADRPGIVAAVTSRVAEYGGNITDLTTRLSGNLYVLVCEVDLPADADVDALTAALDAASAGLGVQASLRPADAEVL